MGPHDFQDDIDFIDSVLKPESISKKGAYTRSDLADILREAGWDESLVPTMSAVGMAESSGKTGAYNPGVGHGGKPTVEQSIGLWQINMHPSLGRKYDRKRLASDPVYNAKVAKEIYDSQGLRAWGAYTDGRYKNYLNQPISSVRPIPAPRPDPVAEVDAMLSAFEPASDPAPQQMNEPEFRGGRQLPDSVDQNTGLAPVPDSLKNAPQPAPLGPEAYGLTPIPPELREGYYKPAPKQANTLPTDYQEYLTALGEPDSQQARQSYNEMVEGYQRSDAYKGAEQERQRYNRGLAAYNRQIDSLVRIGQQRIGDGLVGVSNPIASRIATTPEQILSGGLYTATINVDAVPEGEDVRRFVMRTALKPYIGQNGITASDIDAYLAATSDLKLSLGSGVLTPEAIEKYKQRWKTSELGITVHNALINDLLQWKHWRGRTKDRVEPELRAAIDERATESPYYGALQAVNDRRIAENDASEKRIREGIENSTSRYIGEKIEDVMTGIANIGALRSAAPYSKPYDEKEQEQIRAKRTEDALDDIRRRYNGNFLRYEADLKARDEKLAQMGYPEWLTRHAAEFSDGFLSGVVTGLQSMLVMNEATKENFGNVATILNPVDALDRGFVAIRDGVLGYKDPEEVYAYLSKDIDLDKQELYSALAWLQENVFRQDEGLGDGIASQVSRGAGSLAYFLTLGRLMGGSTAATAFLGATQSVAPMYDQLRKQKNLTNKDAATWAVITGVPQGLTEVVGTAGKANAIVEAFKTGTKLSKNGWKVAARVLKETAEEGGQEGIQNIMQDASVRALNALDRSAIERLMKILYEMPRNVTGETVEAATVGGILGAGTQTAITAGQSLGKDAKTPEVPSQPPSVEAQPEQTTRLEEPEVEVGDQKVDTFKRFPETEGVPKQENTAKRETQGVPAFISKAREQQLKDLGYAQSAIDAMKPADAEMLVRNKVPPGEAMGSRVTTSQPMTVYRAERSGRGQKTDAIRGATYFFPTREMAELWAGDNGTVIERQLDVSDASFQPVPEGGINTLNRETGQTYPVVVRTDPEGSGQILEIAVLNQSRITDPEEAMGSRVADDTLQREAQSLVSSNDSLKRVSVIGSSVDKGIGGGRDVDLLFEFAPQEITDGDDVANLLESLNVGDSQDIWDHDLFVKVGDRYFHKSMGAGVEFVENNEYAAEQKGKPVRVLADASEQGLEQYLSQDIPDVEVVDSNLNASGESAASLEAQNRLASEKAKGKQRYVRDLRSNKRRPLIGVDAVDYVPRPWEQVEWEDGEVIARGADSPMRSVSTPEFYSQSERTVEEKMPNAAPAGQVMAILNKGGAKKEELDWLGIEQWLAGKGKVSKEDVLQFIRENSVDLQEIVKGDENWDGDDLIAGGNRVATLIDNGDGTWSYESDLSEGSEVFQTRDDARREAESEQLEGPYTTSGTKFSQYTLPGGENYREMLLTIPAAPPFTAHNIGIGWEVRSADGQVFGVYAAKDAADAIRIAKDRGPTDAYRGFRSSHWDEPNVLVHIRFDDRVDAKGRKTLHIAEIQSDWHQKGRKKGYATELTEKQQTKRNTLTKRLKSLRTRQAQQATNDMAVIKDAGDNSQPQSDITRLVNTRTRNYDNYQRQIDAVLRELDTTTKVDTVPNAPFKSNWHELALKRMLRYAVENGYDAVSWDTGTEQVDRYTSAIRQNVDAVNWTKQGDSVNIIATKDGQETFNEVVPLEGSVTISGEEADLDDLLGKSMAKQVRESSETQGSIEGDDLTIGGEFHKFLYDKAIPFFLNKYAKKWGARVEGGSVSTRATLQRGDDEIKELTPEEADSLLASGYEVTGFFEDAGAGDVITPQYYEEQGNDLSGEVSHFWLEPYQAEMVDGPKLGDETTKPVHSLPITDKMRESVSKGQPMFRKADAEGREQLKSRRFVSNDALTTAIRSRVTQDGELTELEINTFGGELLRRIHGGQPIEGMMIPNIDSTIQAIEESGYAVEGHLKDFVDNLKEVADANRGTAVAYVFEDALAEERGHQAVALARTVPQVNQIPRTAARTIAAIARKSGLFKQQYSDIPAHQQAEEFVVKMLTGQRQKYGVSSADAARAINIFSDGFLEANPDANLDEFSRIGEDYAQALKTKAGIRRGSQKTSDGADVQQPELRGPPESEAGGRQKGGQAPPGQTQQVEFTPDGDEKESQTPYSIRGKMDVPVENRVYTGVSNAKQKRFAADVLDMGAEEAENWFNQQVQLNQGNAGATIAVGTSLIHHYGTLGDIEGVQRVTDVLTPFGTDVAQTLQAFAIIGMWNPEAAGAYAARKAAQSGRDITKEDYDKAVDYARQMSGYNTEESAARGMIQVLQRKLSDLRDERDALKKTTRIQKGELSAALKDLEAIRKQVGVKPTFAKDPKTQKELHQQLKARESEILANIEKKFGAAVMNMVVPDDTIMRAVAKAQYDDDVIDYATLKLLDAFKDQIAPDTYMRELDRALNAGGQAFSQEKLAEILLVATQRTRQFGKRQTDEQRTTAANRRKFYDLADNYQLERVRKDAWRAEEYPNVYIRQLAITGAEMKQDNPEAYFLALARRAGLTEDEMLEQFADKFEPKSKTEIHKLLVEADKLHQQTAKDLYKRNKDVQTGIDTSEADLEFMKERERVAKRNKAALTRKALSFYATLTRSNARVVTEALVALRRANLLTSLKTHFRNFLGSAVFAGAEEVSRNPAAFVDTIISAYTKRRTITATSVRQLRRAFKNLVKADETILKANRDSGIKTAGRILRYGDSVENLTKLNLTESFVQGRVNNKATRAFDAYVNGVFRSLSGADAFFKVFAFRKSLEDQARAIALTEHRADKSVNVKERMMELVLNPLQVMIREAEFDADVATFQNSNQLSNAFTKLKSLHWGIKSLAELIVPYDRTPTNIILQTLNYSPFGFVRAGGIVVKAARRTDNDMKNLRNAYQEAVEEDLRNTTAFLKRPANEQARMIDEALQDIFTRKMQREFARTVGRAGVGTATMYLGFLLAQAGRLAGYMDPDEERESDEFFARAYQGVENGSILLKGIGRFRVTDDPYGKALTLGATFYEQVTMRGDWYTGMTSALEHIIKEQPLINGLDSLLDAMPTVIGGKSKVGQFAGNIVSTTAVPAFVRDVGEVVDPKARTGSGYTEGESRYKRWDEWARYQRKGFANTMLKSNPVTRQYADESKFQNPELRPKTWYGRSKYMVDLFRTQPPIPYEIGAYRAPDAKPLDISPKGVLSASNASQAIEVYDQAVFHKKPATERKKIEKALITKYKRARSDKSWETYELFFEFNKIPYKKLTKKQKDKRRRK